jgi:hypothetical protein
MVTDIAARKFVLRQKGRCFQWLRSNHIIRDCPSEKRCFKCGQRHHTSICPKLLGSFRLDYEYEIWSRARKLP